MTYIPAGKVAAAFEKGVPLVETAGYKVHASRREAPGMAEVHVRDTDVIYVIEGTATVITGGEVVEGKTIGRTKSAVQRFEAGPSSGWSRATCLSFPTASRTYSRNCRPHSFITS